MHLAALLTLRVALSPWPKGENLLFLFPDWLMGLFHQDIEAGVSYCVAITVHIQIGAQTALNEESRGGVFPVVKAFGECWLPAK